MWEEGVVEKRGVYRFVTRMECVTQKSTIANCHECANAAATSTIPLQTPSINTTHLYSFSKFN